VTHLPVANQVYHNVFAELLAVLSCSFERPGYILKTVSINMENWRANRLGNFGTVVAGPSLNWTGCETNLVVDNNVDNASYFVVLEVLELQAFKNDTLPSERRITMYNYGHNLCAGLITSTKEVLFGSDTAHDDWVNGLQVRGVCHQGDLDLLALSLGVVGCS